MNERKKKPRPWQREPSDAPDVIFGGRQGQNATTGFFGIPGDDRRYPGTGFSPRAGLDELAGGSPLWPHQNDK